MRNAKHPEPPGHSPLQSIANENNLEPISRETFVDTRRLTINITALYTRIRFNILNTSRSENCFSATHNRTEFRYFIRRKHRFDLKIIIGAREPEIVSPVDDVPLNIILVHNIYEQ